MSEEISKKCSANGCDKKSKKNGFCLHHDYKNKRYGDPNHIVVRPIAKTKSEIRKAQRKAEEKYRQSNKGKTTKRKYNSSLAGKQRRINMNKHQHLLNLQTLLNNYSLLQV